jgi:hypothetical protein
MDHEPGGDDERGARRSRAQGAALGALAARRRTRVSRVVIARAATLGRVHRLLALPLLLAATGCGSLRVHQLPPPATPAGSVAGPVARRVNVGGGVAVLRPRARVLELRGERAGAGVGPAAVAADPRGRWLYVTDTTGGALLVFAVRPRLELVHRVYLPGAPYGIGVRGDRIRVTLSARNRIAELNVRRRPQRLATR